MLRQKNLQGSGQHRLLLTEQRDVTLLLIEDCSGTDNRLELQ